ncbi:transposase [Stutzerimonas zhaodongensis]|uniref:Transposase n=1 Tax=Stutzerimonas zhaodongensis TaxID=1176257 RepID=A0A365PR64_9GAMM|nr:TniB family NTP-binding protein [Stutzerimonas zhaodongensis]RBA54696.1 transposase [Stutzerimonas zhaodongensis]
MIDGQHLSPNRRALLSLDDDCRIVEIQNDRVWVDNSQSENVFGMVDNVLAVPERNQAPCLLIYGEGGTGKSSIARRIKSFKKFRQKLIYVDLTVKPNGLKFSGQILFSLGVPGEPLYSTKSFSRDLSAELLHIIRLRGIKGIVFDEFHDAFLVPRLEQHRNLSMIKGLSNAPYGLSVIGFGTSSALASLKSDSQFYRRFTMIDLPDWSDSEEFRSFLLGIEGQLPLKKQSYLDSEEFSRFLLERTGGRMDSVIRILRSSACYAIRSGEERITLDLMRSAFSSPWGY